MLLCIVKQWNNISLKSSIGYSNMSSLIIANFMITRVHNSLSHCRMDMVALHVYLHSIDVDDVAPPIVKLRATSHTSQELWPCHGEDQRPYHGCEVRMDHVAGPLHILLAEKEGRTWLYKICLKIYQFERTTWWCCLSWNLSLNLF